MLFILLGLPAAIILALITPPGHVPDEYNHLCRADSLRYGTLIGHRGVIDGQMVSGVPCNAGLRLIMQLPARPMDLSPEPYTRKMDRFSRTIRWRAAPEFLEGGSIAGYMPLFYVPGALAIAMTHALGGLPAAAFCAVRFANLACFGVIGLLALGVAQRGRAVMACTMVLPMTLSLAASCSQDGLLIATTVLACACVTRVDASAAGARWRLCAAVLLAVIIASKPPYAPLALLLFLPAPRPLLRNMVACVLVILPALVWVGLELHVAAVPPRLAAAAAGPLWPDAPAIFTGPDFAAQLHVLLARPWRLVTLPWRTLTLNASELARQAIGVLDFLSIRLPRALYVIWLTALIAAILSDIAARQENSVLSSTNDAGDIKQAMTKVFWSFFSKKDCLLAFVSIVAAASSADAVALALYLQWTPVGMPWIGGVEGRYFLPLLPVLALALPRVAMPRLRTALNVIPLCAALTNLIWLPRVVMAFYAER